MTNPQHADIIDNRYVVTTFYDENGRITGSTVSLAPWVENDDA